ncbi:M28 family peptidase [Chloroflexota bacterium]
MISNEMVYKVNISPYSLPCNVTAELTVVSSLEALEKCSCRHKILLMMGPICSEQLMPKNFVFYNPDHHKRIYALLEEKQPAAIIKATLKNPELVGAMHPFPVIEDGDFNIPSVYCEDSVGHDIIKEKGDIFSLTTIAKRIPSSACNVVARKNQDAAQKIVICAHIDAYGDSPGASDNASGTTVLLLLAEMLSYSSIQIGIEIIAINGEDNYSAVGEKDYLTRYSTSLHNIALVINIDDIGYYKGDTAYSLYECSHEIQMEADNIFRNYPEIIPGEPWYQSDHMVFVQKYIPAMAITSEHLVELMASITHSPKDTPDIVSCALASITEFYHTT